MTHLIVRGASDHNLHQVDLDLPLGQWTAVVGPSGSGKSSLVMDTVVREGQRRFLSGLSARARRFTGKLGRADVAQMHAVPAAIAIGGGTARANPRSTVGTLTGALGPLRLWFARRAVHPDGTPLMRSHFAFNHPEGQCPECQGLGVQDAVDPALIIADASKSIREGALVPTLKNGYTVYSQVTVEVMDTICRAHGFTVDTPWNQLTDAQRDVILYGTTALTVPFGKHSLESRMKWEGITARPREEGHYRGLVPVIEETLARSRNDNILRFARSVPCAACDGTRLGPVGRAALLNGVAFAEVVRQPVAALDLAALDTGAVADAVRPALERRLGHMVRLGLGHLSLDRASTTLSGGEAQRVRLVAQLAADLSGVLYALDEPTLGLHPDAQPGLAAVLRELVHAGNTVVTIEHDPDMVRYADHLVRVGPGSGPQGGRIVHAGTLPPDPLGVVPPAGTPRVCNGAIRLTGACLHNLQSVDLTVPLGAFTVVRGPSGAGKTSLVTGTLVPALTGVAGGPYDALDGVPDALAVQVVDATPIGRTPRSTPATWTGLFDRIRKRFAAASGEQASLFSYNTKKGRCAHCEGLGVERITLHLLEDAAVTCPVCDGARYAPHVLHTRVWGLTIAEVLDLSVDQAVSVFREEPDLLPTVQALHDLGLGYLSLGQSSTSLSRGEAQRVKLSPLLARVAGEGATLVVFDEPDRGLHPSDVTRLLACIDRLIDAGHTVLAISHHRHVWAAADALVTLRDGALVDEPLHTGPLSVVRAPEPPVPPADAILTGVRTHGLDVKQVTFPANQFTVVTGPSGSGKSSLVMHTLAAESWRRFAESLPFAARSAVRRTTRPDVDEASGLRPTIALTQSDGATGTRSTVATLTELGPLLRLLWSRTGVVNGVPTTLTLSHFSPDRAVGACPACAGRGMVGRCDPDRLITDAAQPLFDGAMNGTRPGRFFGEATGQYAATLAAVAPGVDWDAPYNTLSEQARRVALYGAGDTEVDVTWRFSRGKRSGEHQFTGKWLGLCALVEAEATNRANARAAAEWAEPLVDVACPECSGSGLTAEARAVTVNGRTLPECLALPVSQLPTVLTGPDAVLAPVREQCADLVALGVGHLTLDRRSASLSGGELQRVRLAGVLRSGLTGTLVVLDEPDAGLHDDDIAPLLARLRALCDAGNSVVVVSHRATTIAAADTVIALGEPCAVTPPAPRLVTTGAVRIEGAHANTLRGFDVDLPEAGIVAIGGVSGSGKSTLLHDVIGASARAQEPRGCARAVGFDRFRSIVEPGRATGGPLSALGLLSPLQSLFAKQGALSRAAFSMHSPKGRCPTCKGRGVERVAMDGLGDVTLTCPTCQGSRFKPEVLAVTWEGLSIAQVLDTSVSALPPFPRGALRDGVAQMQRFGLSHLSLGRRRGTLSGGEAQRLSLAAAFSGETDGPRLVLLDEPGRGLHDSEVAALAHVLRGLADAGDLVIVATHRAPLWASADVRLTLGPGAGGHGGRLM